MPPALQNPIVLWLLLTAVVGTLAHLGLRKELRVRATLFSAFLLACLVAIWPPWDTGDQPGRIRLGLDLKGGMHLVMRVITDDALIATVDDAVQAVRSQANRKGITFVDIRREDPRTLTVEGVETARVKEVRELLEDHLGDGWAIRENAGNLQARMNDAFVGRLKERTVQETITTLGRRVNELGVAEPVISAHGTSNDQILVQLPGVTDVERAKKLIKQTAQLTLKLVENAGGSKEALLESYQGKLPAHLELVSGQEDGTRTYYLVRKEAIITGRDLKNARMGIDENNAPDIEFSLNPNGTTKFKRATGRNIGRRLAIILDGTVYSAPNIEGQIGAEGRISGRFTTEEADDLAKVLRAGALPATLEYLQELTVGASLGRDSIRSGVVASLGALSFIIVFMLIYYRLSGVNAVVALTANLLILLGAMAYSQATLTLPGIAGVILTVGVGVDTNVLVFERIREELRNGKTPKSAVHTGFERVWLTIVDTHATGLIAAAFLFQFGTGPIKGFAVTVFIGLVANVFASFFASRFLFECALGKRSVTSLSI